MKNGKPSGPSGWKRPASSDDGVMTESKEKLLIDIHELSALTGIAVGSLYHWASPSQGRIPCVRLGARCLRFSLSAIREWLAEQSVPAGDRNFDRRNKR